MLQSLFQSSSLPVLEQVVKFTQARHGVLAGNIANHDTPGYKTRDLNVDLFQEKLQTAIASRDRGTSNPPFPSLLAPPSPPPFDSRFPDSRPPVTDNLDAFREVDASMKSILYHDQSDVAIEKQITEIAKNQAMHNLALSLMVSQMNLLSTAISENVT